MSDERESAVNLAVLAPAVLGAGWVVQLSRRTPPGAARAAVRAVAGGTAAFALAALGYALLERRGMRISWSELTAGGGGSVVMAAAIGFVEEGAKLVGLCIASIGLPRGRGGLVRRIVAVSAVFASLECMFTMGGGDADAAVILLRAAFAPIAHAALSLPLGLALVGGAKGIRWVLPALLAAAVLHGASDLSLAIPQVGRLGYAAVLCVPAVALHLRARVEWARQARTAGA
jgi:hypothetical protein